MNNFGEMNDKNSRYKKKILLIVTLILRLIFETGKINRAKGKSNFENIGENAFSMRSSSDLSVESAIRSEGLGWSARSGFSVNAGALFPASVRYLRYGQRKRELRNARLRSRRLVRVTCMCGCMFRKDASGQCTSQA